MEGFHRILLSVYLAMGRIQRGEEGVEAGFRLPTWTQGTLPDYINLVNARATGFSPDLAPDSFLTLSYLRCWCIY